MDLKHRSRGITEGRDRAPARSMFKAIGFTDADLRKPLRAALTQLVLSGLSVAGIMRMVADELSFLTKRAKE